MAEVMIPETTSRHAGSMSGMETYGGPRLEMVSNPDFSFPMRPRSMVQGPAQAQSETEPTRRPSSASASTNVEIPPQQSHRRGASMLPSFNFNAANTSGRSDSETPPRTPDSSDENTVATPSRRGHRRGGSEFVGGDSRLGVTNAVSSSPTKSNPLFSFGPPAAPVAGRRGHAHRRSAAISSHDIGGFMQPPSEIQPRLSSSLPSTPLEQPSQNQESNQSGLSKIAVMYPADPFGPPLATVDRIQSRPRVEFVMTPEIIPRPLSTISSETESSASIMLGHSVNNSLTSMLSMGTPSPPSRTPTISLSTAMEDESRSRAKSSLEVSKRVEKEGEWLKRRSLEGPGRASADPAAIISTTTFVDKLPSTHPSTLHKKKHSSGQSLGFDRRKSEPSIGLFVNQSSRMSAISLQETTSSSHHPIDERGLYPAEHRSSTRKIKDWAATKVFRRPREAQRALTTTSSTSSIRPDSAGSTSVPGKVSRPDLPVAETDLDAVLGAEQVASEVRRPVTPVEFDGPTYVQQANFRLRDGGEHSPILDLDAALGPFKTPSIGGLRQRKELHSSRLSKDFNGPGGHYHRRAESEPLLAPFQLDTTSTPSQSEMADVFEEDEEEDDGEASPLRQPPNTSPFAAGQQNLSVHTRNSTTPTDSPVNSNTTGLGIQGSWCSERPSTPYHEHESSFPMSRAAELPQSSVGSASSAEELGDTESIKIVDADEEPRTSSLTKSSDSSDTPTISFHPPHAGIIANRRHPSTTPTTFHTSSFPTPDASRDQASMDGSHSAYCGSSITDTRTVSSSTAGDHGIDYQRSADDVPSLISSRSSVTHAQSQRTDVGTSIPLAASAARPSEPAAFAERRRKRTSIQSLSQLVGGSFSSKPKVFESDRPQTALVPATLHVPKKQPRLKKLMFWKSKQGTPA